MKEKNLQVQALRGFFCISGYYAMGSTEQKGTTFFLQKLKRLYPEYFLAISLIFVLQLSGLLGAERSVSFLQYLANILFLQVFLGMDFVDGAHWYVLFLLATFAVIAVLKHHRLLEKWITYIAVSIGLIVVAGVLRGCMPDGRISCCSMRIIFTHFCLDWDCTERLTRKISVRSFFLEPA